MSKPGAKGLKRIVNAAYYSMKGFKAGLTHEAALRQELILCVPLTIIAFLIADNAAELIILIVLPWLTFTCEILNSAIEAVVDRIGNEYNELSGRAKDLGSAAVFVMLILTLTAWIIVVGSKLDWIPY